MPYELLCVKRVVRIAHVRSYGAENNHQASLYLQDK